MRSPSLPIAFGFLAALALAPAHATPPPNIVFILADDLGYGEVGFNGQRKILTPNLDRLAQGGLVLSRHYAGNAVCAPSRAVLMTGRHPGHAPIRDNRDIGQGEQVPLPAGTPTIASLLRSAGYSTGLFGKWGLGAIDSTGSPLNQGFQRFLGLTSQHLAHSHYPAFLWDQDQRRTLQNGENGVPGHAAFPTGANPSDPAAYAAFQGRDFSSNHFVAGAETFIQESAQKHSPFFLYYASPLPHISLQLPEEDLKPYVGKFPEDAPFTPEKPGSYVPNRTPKATYAGMITRLDTEVGRILAALEKAGVASNTLVVFSSDNGPTYELGGVDTTYFESASHFRGRKGSLYEGGLREPTVVYWPGVVPAGTRSLFPSGFEDWLPTFAEITGSSQTPETDGESLLPTFRGSPQTRRSPIYREFGSYGHQQALWEGPWKAIRTDMLDAAKRSEPPQTQLYNLESDPSESQDLAAQFPDLVRDLESKMAAARTPHPEFPVAGLDPLPHRRKKP
jgi:arylsulfatase A